MSRNNIIVLCLVSFLSVILFGFGSYAMVTDSNGRMSNCPLMGVAAFCQMNSLEHIAGWQSMLVALFQKETHTFLMLLWVAFSMALSLTLGHIFRKKMLSVQSLPHRPIRILFIPSTLQETFSAGILQSKIYP